MKKALVTALMLSGLFAAQANAAFVTETSDASYNLGTTGSISFIGSNSNEFFDVKTTNTPKTSLSVSMSGINDLIFAVYVNLATPGSGSVLFDDSRVIYTRTLTSINPTSSLNFVPGNWVIKQFSQLPPFSTAVASVPVPAAAWLFGSALVGVGALRRKQKAALAA